MGSAFRDVRHPAKGVSCTGMGQSGSPQASPLGQGISASLVNTLKNSSDAIWGKSDSVTFLLYMAVGFSITLGVILVAVVTYFGVKCVPALLHLVIYKMTSVCETAESETLVHLLCQLRHTMLQKMAAAEAAACRRAGRTHANSAGTKGDLCCRPPRRESAKSLKFCL